MNKNVKIKEDIINNILSCNFDKASTAVENLSYQELENLLLKAGYDYGQSIIVYSFICHLIKKEESVQYHLLAQTILCGPLSYLEGAYKTSLYHNRQLLSLDKNNLNGKLMILFYHTLPEHLIDDSEAKKVAQEIIKLDPLNKVALQYLAQNT